MEDGEYAAAKTSVWWDIENCHVPRTCDPHLIAQNISSALAAVGYRGPVSISAFGDSNNITPTVLQALSSTGIALNHVPSGIKDASDKRILVDMLFWAVDNPPPANYLLISGDRDFSNALHQLRLRRYNILLAQPPNVSQALVAAAKSVWNWKDLVAGGKPMHESPYVNKSAGGTSPSKETFNGSTTDNWQMTQSTGSSASVHLGNQKTCSNGKYDNRYKGKHNRYPNPSQANNATATTISSSEFKQPPPVSHGFLTDTNVPQFNNCMKNPDQMSMSMISSMKAQENSHLNHTSNFFPQSSPQKPPCEATYFHQSETMVFNESSSHEFLQGNWSNSPNGPMVDYAPPHSDSPMKDGKDLYNNHKPHWPPPLRPSDLLPPHPNFQPGNLSSSNSQNHDFYAIPNGPSGPPFTSPQTWTTGPTFPSVPPVNLPEISRVSISDYPSSGQNNGSYSKKTTMPNISVPEHNGLQKSQTMYQEHMHRPVVTHATDSNVPKDELQGNPGSLVSEVAVKNILQALHILKADKMVPNETNIADCIRYGKMNIQNFDIKTALNYAVEHQHVVMHKLGGNLPLYVGKHHGLWKCVNPMDINVRHPKTTWDAVSRFLSSTAGRTLIRRSQSRYQAAIVLRNSCLNHLVLGEILQILHEIINVKKWITPHSSGWQPLSFHLPDADKNTRTSAGTKS
ncbi:hypothetical protein OPV22_030175 [Ensete ventricosum]|uniref:NYN domain-containing protein n=1 Tax=Ensete ventricosum TaxID=4639 RepID=A0AAV8QBA8_ENSVE|nr:hypothetical protein OPV22_030175 [Ensete ventricosum]